MKKHFFNKTLKQFQNHHIQDQVLLTGVSGGLDSMVLLDLLKELSLVLNLKIAVIHIHHGWSSHKKVMDYRNKAQNFVSKYCAPELPCITVKNTGPPLNSEEELRDFRHKNFQYYFKKQQAHWITLAHHHNDLLETRLIQLIRGSGLTGLQSMKAISPPYLRPLLSFSRQEIKQYAETENIKFLEDPSNQDNSFLRNWIRNQWLADLEKKRPGSLKSLSRSLSALSSSQKPDPLLPVIDGQKINRRKFLNLSYEDQKRLLALYMAQLKLSNYGQSHIEELIKHNQRTQKHFQIKLLKRVWLFNPDFIQALKP